MKITKEIELSQLTKEFLPLGVTSLEYDEKTKDLRLNAWVGERPTDVQIQSVIDAHVPIKKKTRTEKIQAVKDSNSLQGLKDALLEIL